MSETTRTSADVAREALAMAAEAVETAREAVTAMQQRTERDIVREAEHVIREVVLRDTIEVARDTIAAYLVAEDAGLSHAPGTPIEQQPDYWCGRLRGILTALVQRLDETGS